MVKGKTGKCEKCGKETLLGFLIVGNGLCKNCVKSKQEKKIEVDGIDDLDIVNGLKSYTMSYLNHKLKINLNSIKKQTCCVEYKGRYILHEDIIKQFKDNLLTNE